MTFIRRCVRVGLLRHTRHSAERSLERGLSNRQLKQALLQGEMIEREPGVAQRCQATQYQVNTMPTMRENARRCDFSDGLLAPREIDVELTIRGRRHVFAGVEAEVCEQCGMECVDDATAEHVDEALLGRVLPKPAKYLRVPVYDLGSRTST